MNDVPPSDDDPADVDEQYRHAAQLDRSRPSDAVRRAILEHATRRAAQHAATRGGQAVAKDPIPLRQKSSHYRFRWPFAVVGTLAAAGIAGLLVAPQLPWRLVAPRARIAPSAEIGPSARIAPSAGTAAVSTPAAPQAEATAPLALQPPRVEPFPAAPQAPALEPRSEGLAARLQRQSVGAAASAASAQSSALGAANRAADAAPRTADVAPRAAAAPRSDNSALREAAASGDLEKLHAMLDEPIGIDAVDAYGRTALMLATLNAKESAVEELLAHGANPNIADAQGRTPLGVARTMRHPEIAAALQRAGAN